MWLWVTIRYDTLPHWLEMMGWALDEISAQLHPAHLAATNQPKVPSSLSKKIYTSNYDNIKSLCIFSDLPSIYPFNSYPDPRIQITMNFPGPCRETFWLSQPFYIKRPFGSAPASPRSLLSDFGGGGPFLFLYFSWALEARRSRRKRRGRRVPRTRLLGEAPGDRIPSFTSFSRKIDSPKMRVLDSILRSTRRMERD